MSRIMSTVFGQLCSWILVTLTTWVACWWLVFTSQLPARCSMSPTDADLPRSWVFFVFVEIHKWKSWRSNVGRYCVRQICRVYPGLCFWRCSCTSRTLSRGFNGSPSSHGRAWSGGFGGRLCRSSKSPSSDPAHQEQASRRFVLRCEDGWEMDWF